MVGGGDKILRCAATARMDPDPAALSHLAPPRTADGYAAHAWALSAQQLRPHRRHWRLDATTRTNRLRLPGLERSAGGRNSRRSQVSAAGASGEIGDGEATTLAMKLARALPSVTMRFSIRTLRGVRVQCGREASCAFRTYHGRLQHAADPRAEARRNHIKVLHLSADSTRKEAPTMVTPVSHVTQIQPSDQPTAAPQPSPKPKPQPVPTDTVTLSPAAVLRQELSETPTQTAAEARSGDIQAKHLLAREKPSGH